jgi:hypothetical protein
MDGIEAAQCSFHCSRAYRQVYPHPRPLSQRERGDDQIKYGGSGPLPRPFSQGEKGEHRRKLEKSTRETELYLQRKMARDFVKDARGFVQDPIIGKPQHAQALSYEISIAFLIVMPCLV